MNKEDIKDILVTILETGKFSGEGAAMQFVIYLTNMSTRSKTGDAFDRVLDVIENAPEGIPVFSPKILEVRDRYISKQSANILDLMSNFNELVASVYELDEELFKAYLEREQEIIGMIEDKKSSLL